MSVQNSDLLLVQRGNQPYRTTAEELSTKIRGDIDVSGPGKDIPIASASQLGVIRVGNNLTHHHAHDLLVHRAVLRHDRGHGLERRQ